MGSIRFLNAGESHGPALTAIIEGLAQRIIRKTVPRVLHNQRILSLDLAGIVAGTKYRGQFEERMKSIMIEPATAKELISTPSRFKIISPRYKNSIIIPSEIIDAFSDSIILYFSRRTKINGMFPITSITAKSIIDAEKNSLMSIFILLI